VKPLSKKKAAMWDRFFADGPFAKRKAVPAPPVADPVGALRRCTVGRCGRIYEGCFSGCEEHREKEATK
jgi:hypothetical protein